MSADLATVGVGTETDGSIVCPSGANGIVGIKPTLGLLSRAGIVPISADQDTAGPMTRNVTDAAVVLGAMTGIDPDDPATAFQAGHAFTDYRQFLDADALDGARIGVWRTGTYDPTVSPEIDDLMNDTVAQLEALGATVVDPGRRPDRGRPTGPSSRRCCASSRTTSRRTSRRTRMPGTRRRSRTSSTSTTRNPDLEGPWNSEIFVQAEATGGRADPACVEARETADAIARASIDDTMAAYDLDAIVAPTNGPAWVTDPVNGDDLSALRGLLEPVRDRGLSADHGAGRVRRAAAGRHLLPRRPVG